MSWRRTLSYLRLWRSWRREARAIWGVEEAEKRKTWTLWVPSGIVGDAEEGDGGCFVLVRYHSWEAVDDQLAPVMGWRRFSNWSKAYIVANMRLRNCKRMWWNWTITTVNLSKRCSIYALSWVDIPFPSRGRVIALLECLSNSSKICVENGHFVSKILRLRRNFASKTDAVKTLNAKFASKFHRII